MLTDAVRASSTWDDPPPAGDVTYAVAKRILDVVMVIASLPIVILVVTVASVAVVVETRGSPFYRQWRVGLRGRPFRLWKLRTMVGGAEHTGPILTQHRDPRITRVGSVLRRWSVDELPQVVNVLLGQMSLVGPRP